MRVGLITPRPDHPLLAATRALLEPRHELDWLDTGGAAGATGADGGDRADGADGGAHGADGARRVPATLADVYLLKARTPRALALAAELEERGVPVVNSSAATAQCQDRKRMASLARSAGLPFAENRTFARLRDLAADSEVRWPLVVKSRHSRRDDLVTRIDGPAQLRELCGKWSEEPVVVQPFTGGDGWDRKHWVIGDRVFAARRGSELADGAGADRRTVPMEPGELPDSWRELALRTGRVFSLDVYGVDVLVDVTGDPVIVDVNAFPGARGQEGAPEALAALALRTAEQHRERRPGPSVEGDG